jgi:hypothetical protein
MFRSPTRTANSESAQAVVKFGLCSCAAPALAVLAKWDARNCAPMSGLPDIGFFYAQVG